MNAKSSSRYRLPLLLACKTLWRRLLCPLWLVCTAGWGLAGTYDPVAGFNPDINGMVYTAAVQADGRILIGGEFSSVNGVERHRLARLNADGTLDENFNPVLIAGGSVRTIALQADGKIMVGGSFIAHNGVTGRSNLARLEADGSLDTGFESDPNGAVSAMALQGDGKLVLAGDFTSLGGGTASKLARLHTNGSIDAGFLATQIDAGVHAVLIQPDGRILIGGEFTTISTQPVQRLARLETSGFPDTSFSPNPDGTVYSLALQADGRILTGGSFSSIAGSSRGNLARIDADGGIDPTFVTGTDMDVTSLTLQTDGDILVGGWFTTVGGQPGKHLAKLAADGTPDPAFTPNPDLPVLATTLLEDGRILVAGAFSSIGGSSRANCALLGNEPATSHFLVHGLTRAEWQRSGSAPAFNRVILESSTDGGASWSPLGPASLTDNRWQLDGLGLSGSGIVRARGHTADGSTYNGSGEQQATASYPIFTVTFDPGTTGTRTSGGELMQRIQPGGDALAPTLETIGNWIFIGWDTDFTAVSDNLEISALYALPGDPDEDFGPPATGFISGVVRTIALQADGKILVGGDFTSLHGGSQAYLARLHADGTPDNSFAPTINSRVHSIAVQPDGKILIGGSFNVVNSITRPFCARLMPDGTLDSGFAPGVNGQVHALALESDGSILVGGSFNSVAGTSRSNLARLESDGSLDQDFYPRPGGPVYCLAIESDGSVLVGGNFSTVIVQTSPSSSTYYPRYCLARFSADGTFDTGFAPNPNYPVWALALRPNGQIYVGGSFTAMNGSAIQNLGRLNANGTLDASFWPAPNASVYCLSLQQDGSLYVGGLFTTIRGNSYYGRLTRLTDNGEIDSGFAPARPGSPFFSGAQVLAIAQQADGKVLAGGISHNSSGLVYSYFDRLWNTPARQPLALTSADRLAWWWSDTSPQASRVDVEISLDAGNQWHPVAPAIRTGTGWELTGLALLGSGQIRARAFIQDGSYQSGSGIVEDVLSYDFGGTAHRVSFDPGAHGRRGGGGYLTQTIAPGGAATAPTLMVDDGWLFTGWDQSFDSVAGDLTVTAQYTLAPGELDPGFSASVSGSSVSCSVLMPDGGMLIGGTFTQVNGSTKYHIARLLADGTLDSGFTAYTNGSVYCLAPQADGKVLVGGNFTAVNGAARSYLVRLNADGTTDSTFRTSTDKAVTCIEPDGSGGFFIGGYFTYVSGGGVSPGAPRQYFARLDGAGVIDTAWDVRPNYEVHAIERQADGKVFIGGAFTAVWTATTQSSAGRTCLARLNADGSVDGSFVAHASGAVRSILTQPDGKILVGGDFMNIGGVTRYRIARLSGSGAVDSFAPAVNSSVYALALQCDGMVLAGGNFTLANGATRNRLARFDAIGNLDGTLAPSFDSTVYSINLQCDGHMLVGGAFTSVDGHTRYRIARLVLEAATESLAVSPGRIEWLRGGSCAEVSEVGFEYSADGNAPWQALGAAARISGGWQLDIPDLERSGTIRACARHDDGSSFNGSGIYESTLSYHYHLVNFDPGSEGRHSGGGELVQWVADGETASSPDVTPLLGWTFEGWDQPFTAVHGDLTVHAQYSATPSSFQAWMEARGLSGDPATVFNQSDMQSGLPHGLAYALGDNRPAGEPVLKVRLIGERRILEVIAQDAATQPFVSLSVSGSTRLEAGSWDLPLSISADTAGKPTHCEWFEQDGTPAPAAYYRLQATMR